MRKIKRILLLLLTCSTMFILSGCGVELKLENLNKYVSIGGEGSTTSATTHAKNKMEDALGTLNNIKNTYGNLTLDLGSDFSTVVTGMENKLNSAIGSTKLINTDGTTTEAGDLILNSIVINESEVNTLLLKCMAGIEHAVTDRILGISGTSINTNALNFDGSTASSAQQSDINRTLTLLGYEITNVEVKFYYANDADDDINLYNTAFNGGHSADDYAASFIKNDYRDNSSCNKTTWTVSTSTKPDTDTYDFYYFSINTSGLNDTHSLNDGNGNEVPVLCATCAGTGDKELRVNMPAGACTSTNFSNCYGHTDSHPNCNKGTTPYDWLLNVKKDHDGALDEKGDFKDLRGIFLSQTGKIAVAPTDGWHWEGTDSNGYYTSYENIIAAHTQVCEGAHESTYWGFYTVRVTFDYCGNDGEHIDIRDYTCTSKTDADFNSYSALPAEVAKSISMEDIIKSLQTVSKAKVVVLKSDLSSSPGINTATSLYDYTKALGKSIKLDSNAPFKILKKSGGTDFTIDLLKMVAAPGFKVEDAIVEETIPLYIGDVEVGNWYITTFHADLAQSINATSISSNGVDGTEKLQRFKVYQGSNLSGDTSQVYILFGLNDILYVDRITAEDKDDESHSYKPVLNTTTMVYNMLNDCIFSYSGDKQAVMFKSDAVKFYDASNIVINHRSGTYKATTDTSNTRQNNYYSAQLIEETDTNTAMKDLKSLIESNTGSSPLVLNMYLEGLYLPNQYEQEVFVCLGRKLIFDYRWFENVEITENTPAFTIYTPTAETTAADDMLSHYVNELTSSTLQKREVEIGGAKYDIPGIIRLPYKGQTDVIRNYSTTTTLATTSTFRDKPIYSGEFLTTSDTVKHGGSADYYALFAREEPALHSIIKNAPKLFVWCTSANVNTQLVDYLGSQEFSYWQTWLKNNGYPNYLNNTDSESIVEEIVHKIEAVYDLTFDEDAAGKDILIDTSGLEQLDDWINRQTEQKSNAIINIILRVIAIILLMYGILLLICYIIDVAVTGEGEGLLKKVTFNRMMSVTNMSKEERQAMSLKNEKGTYTTRATSLSDLLPVILVMWVIATLLIIGSAYDVVDTLIKMAKQITQIVRGAIGKE